MRQSMRRSEIEELFSEDNGVRSSAARKLGVRNADRLESEDYLAEVAERLASADGEAALPALHRLLGHPDALVRANAACSVAVLEPDLGVPILETLLSENDREVRRRALATLCRIRPPGVGPLLSRTLLTLYQAKLSIDPSDDWTRDLRRRMAVALGWEGEAYAVNSLRQAIRDGDPQVRAAAAWALGKIRNPAAMPDLVDALDDRDGAVRQRVVEALGSCGIAAYATHCCSSWMTLNPRWRPRRQDVWVRSGSQGWCPNCSGSSTEDPTGWPEQGSAH